MKNIVNLKSLDFISSKVDWVDSLPMIFYYSQKKESLQVKLAQPMKLVTLIPFSSSWPLYNSKLKVQKAITNVKPKWFRAYILKFEVD